MKPTISLPDAVERFLSTLTPLADGVVVALSGGPDSMALAHALLGIRDEIGLGPVVLAHLNHRLRGNDSDTDELFVREWYTAQQRRSLASVTLRCHTVDIPAAAEEERANLEALARKLRYEWLVSVAQTVGARFVATGHTASDQAETVLHRLVRGTGLRGLRGIPACRQLTPDIQVIRPLLGVQRADVLAYLRAEKQSFREDSSNRNLSRTRNRIRHELLPLLAEKFNPAIVEVLCQLSEQASVAFARDRAEAAALLSQAELPSAGTRLVFARAPLTGRARPLIREMYRLAWQRRGWPEQAMNFQHWDRLAAVTLGEIRAVDLPGGIRAHANARVVQLGPAP